MVYRRSRLGTSRTSTSDVGKIPHLEVIGECVETRRENAVGYTILLDADLRSSEFVVGRW